MGWSRRRRWFELSCFCAVSMLGCSLFVDTSGLQGESGDAATTPDGALDSGVDADAQISGEASPGDGSTTDAGSAYATTILADGPVAYYRLNETSGNSITSEIGGFTGSFTRGTTLGSPSPVTREPGNLAATFFLESGTDDSDLSLGDNFIFPGTHAFSVEMWFNASTIDGFPRHVLSKADRAGDAPVDGWNVCVSMDPGPVVWIERIGNGDTLVRSIAVTIAQGSTFHFVGVFDGANLIPYVNGVSSASTTAPGSIIANATSAFMGSANGNVNSGHGFIGDIDEVAIYDKVLTPTQVAAHFTAGKP